MDETPDTDRYAAASALEPTEPPSGSRRRVWAIRIAVGLAIFVLFSVAVDYATSSPVLCSSCHGMDSRALSWAKSTHAEVGCVSCHQPPTEWYELPQRLAARTRLLSRDIGWQLSGRSAETTGDASSESTSTTASVSSDNCLACHDVNRKATSGFRIKIDHAEHAKRNETCLSCHVNTAHPEPTRGTPLSLMDQCFTCHGTAQYPEASAACSLCHPQGYELKPQTHEAVSWEKEGHSTLAKSDRAQCDLCHKPKFCTDCHGLEMPHPDGWAKKGAASHSNSADANREVCAKCHTEQPDLCSMCHHQGWNPGRGPWVTQHPLMVGDRGADFCMRCHTRAYCSYCHVSSSLGTPSSPATQ